MSTTPSPVTSPSLRACIRKEFLNFYRMVDYVYNIDCLWRLDYYYQKNRRWILMAGIDLAYSQVTRINYSNSWQEAKLYTDGQDEVATAIQTHWGQNNGVEKQLGPAYKVELSSQLSNAQNDSEIRRMKQTGKIECQTCKERQYQDGSNDPGVSFKASGHISPESSAAVVRAHEQEHVNNEQANAQNEGREIVAQSVRLFSSICSECGKAYVSGGETRTTTATDTVQQPSNQEVTLGNNVDLVA